MGCIYVVSRLELKIKRKKREGGRIVYVMDCEISAPPANLFRATTEKVRRSRGNPATRRVYSPAIEAPCHLMQSHMKRTLSPYTHPILNIVSSST